MNQVPAGRFDRDQSGQEPENPVSGFGLVGLCVVTGESGGSLVITVRWPCGVLPGLIFTVLVVRKIGGDSAAFLGTAALAEFGKLALTGLLCAAVFIWVKPLAAGYFFLGMISVLIAGWAGLALAFQGR